MSSISPTQRAVKVIKDRKLPYEIVQYWNSFSQTRKDLFGLYDLLIIVPNAHFVGLQVSTFSNRSSHVNKMTDSKFLIPWLSTHNKAQLWSWRETKTEQGFVFDSFSLKEGAIVIETIAAPFDFIA